MRSVHNMAKGVGFIVGDGKSIKVTGDIWVGKKSTDSQSRSPSSRS